MGERDDGNRSSAGTQDDTTRSWPGESAPAPAPAPAPGVLLGGRFMLLSELGRGGSGRVFAATDTSVGQKVALKVFHAEVVDERARERLRREVRAARPGHPNAVTMFELHDVAGRPVLSMELVEGKSLRELLTEHERLSVPETIALIGQVAAALAHFHERGLVHRDVKPGNILVTSDGTAKLCDMGLMRPLEHGLTVTFADTVVGTPAYMAPEQASGSELGTAADVYALGLTLFQCLTGDIPLVESTAVATVVRRQHERAPWVRRECPWCPPWLCRLVHQMLDRDPARRPSAAEVTAALASGNVRRRIRWGWVAATGALVLAGGAAVVGMQALEVGRAVRMEVVDSGIRGVDAHGATAWQVELPAAPSQVLQVDLTGDGEPELVAAVDLVDRSDERSSPPPASEIVAVTRSGRVVTRAQPRSLVGRWAYPYPVHLVPQLKAIDLDGDGRPELVAVCRQANFYPTAVLVYWPRWDHWEDLLHHSGYVIDVTTVASSPPTIRLVAFNNRLGMATVVGEVEITPPGERAATLEVTPLWSPETGVKSSLLARWRLYVPVGEGRLARPVHIDVTPDGGTLVTTGAGTLRLDAHGNPWESPNRGRDLRELRMWFVDRIAELSSGYGLPAAESVEAFQNRVKEQAAPLLVEDPYAAILAVKTARRLAQVGALGRGMALLEAARPGVRSFDEVRYRLIHLEALDRRLDAALGTAEDLFRTGVTSRADFDTSVLAMRIAIEARDAADVALAISRIVNQQATRLPYPGMETALWARAHLWWDEATELDTRVQSWPLAPAGVAVACLARWRLGRTAAEDLGLMSRAVANDLDAETEIALAAAAVELALDRPRDALARLEAVSAALEPLARDNFEQHQLMDLCHALHVRALAAAGERRHAQVEGTRLLRTLTPGLLPAHLVEEMLSRSRDLLADDAGTGPPAVIPAS